MIRQTKRSREALHGFLRYTEQDDKIDHPHVPAPERKRRRAAAHRTLRARLHDDAAPRLDAEPDTKPSRP